MKKVAIVMGTAGDWDCAKAAAQCLKKFGVPYTVNVISAYRTPARALEFSGMAIAENIGVIIAVSSPTAHLSVAMAASTVLPVIAVPVDVHGSGSNEAWLTYAQAPSGVPVATVGVNSSENAALLAIQMLAIGDKKLTNALVIFKQEMTDTLVEEDFMLQQEVLQL